MWGIQLITVTPPAKDELARRYPMKLALYGEDWKAPRTPTPHFMNMSNTSDFAQINNQLSTKGGKSCDKTHAPAFLIMRLSVA